MSGIGLTIDLTGLPALEAMLGRLEHLDPHAILRPVAAIGEMQTRRRIEEEKTAPDGTAWPPNRAGTSILLQSGEHLRDSLAHSVSGAEAEWGSSWEFAHVHQQGMVITPRYGEALKFWFVKGGATEFAVAKQVTIPARPFLGLSHENAEEIEMIVVDALGNLLP